MRILSIVGALTISTVAVAAEEKIKLEAAPSAVQESLKKAIGTGALHDVSRETEEGKTVYEANFRVEKAEHSVKVDETGKLIETEKQVDQRELPAAVSQAVQKLYATAKIEDVVVVTAGDKTFYELEVEIGEVDRELKVDPTGKVLEDKVRADDDDEVHEDKDEGKKEKD